jgi:glycosyltransferase involved in cell wall biosynthesis
MKKMRKSSKKRYLNYNKSIERYDMSEKGPILWYCWFGIGTGYTSVSETIIPELEKLGYKVYINDAICGTGEILTPHFKELYQNYFEDQKTVDYKKCPQIMCWSTEFFNMLDGKYKIGWGFLESTKLAHYHVDSCNRTDCLIVNSEWIKQVYINSGVTVPIYVVPPCVNSEDFPELDRISHEPFTFFHNGFIQERKNPLQMLEGYVNTFPDDGKTKFILFSKHVPEVEKMINDMYNYRKDIEFIFNKKPLTRKKLSELYHRADCYVNISHGEGLSIPDMEAMSTGLPVIGSNWDSRGVFLDNEVGWMVKIDGFTKAFSLMTDICGKWASYNTQDYMRLLKYVVEHPEEVRVKGKKAAERIRKEFTPEKTASALDKILQKVQSV